jgi:nicotinamidase-related amidase
MKKDKENNNHPRNMASGYPPAAFLDRKVACSPLAYPASQTALLLLDYYSFFQTHLRDGDFKSIIARAAALRAWALSGNRAGMLVVHGLIDVRGSNEVLATHKSVGRLTGFQKVMMATPGAEEEAAELVCPEDSDSEILVRRKPGVFSALLSYGLAEELEKRGIKSLIIGGVATSAVVMSTVRGAADQGFVLTVARDACGDPDLERHEVLLDKIVPGFANVVTVEELKETWEKE